MSCFELTYPVKDLEGLPDLVLGVLLVDLHGHHGQELGEVDRAGAVLVHLVHHVLCEIRIRKRYSSPRGSRASANKVMPGYHGNFSQKKSKLLMGNFANQSSTENGQVFFSGCSRIS